MKHNTYEIVQFIGSSNQYLIPCDNSGYEVFRLVDEKSIQASAMEAETIECSLLSGRARVIGKTKITIEISLI